MRIGGVSFDFWKFKIFVEVKKMGFLFVIDVKKLINFKNKLLFLLKIEFLFEKFD